jgi:hypothetical protein
MILSIWARGLIFAVAFSIGWGVVLYLGFGACFDCALSAMWVYVVVGWIGVSILATGVIRSSSPAMARVRERFRRPPWRVVVALALIWGVTQGAVGYFIFRSLGRASLAGLLVAAYFFTMVSLLAWLYRGLAQRADSEVRN